MKLDDVLKYNGATWEVRARVGDIVVCRRHDLDEEATTPEDLLVLSISPSTRRPGWWRCQPLGVLPDREAFYIVTPNKPTNGT